MGSARKWGSKNKLHLFRLARWSVMGLLGLLQSQRGREKREGRKREREKCVPAVFHQNQLAQCPTKLSLSLGPGHSN